MTTESGRESNDWDRVWEVGLDKVIGVSNISVELRQEFAVADQPSAKIQHLDKKTAYEGAAEWCASSMMIAFK